MCHNFGIEARLGGPAEPSLCDFCRHWVVGWYRVVSRAVVTGPIAQLESGTDRKAWGRGPPQRQRQKAGRVSGDLKTDGIKDFFGQGGWILCRSCGEVLPGGVLTPAIDWCAMTQGRF